MAAVLDPQCSLAHCPSLASPAGCAHNHRPAALLPPVAVNNGVYKCGFATTQEGFTKAETELFGSLDELEQVLRWVCGRISKDRWWRAVQGGGWARHACAVGTGQGALGDWLARAVLPAALCSTLTDTLTHLDQPPAAPTLPLPCSRQRFVCGERFTEADLRLFPTLIRFDTAYATLFKCCKRRVADYPHLQAWMRDVHQLEVPGGGMQIKVGRWWEDGEDLRVVCAESSSCWCSEPASAACGVLLSHVPPCRLPALTMHCVHARNCAFQPLAVHRTASIWMRLGGPTSASCSP